MQAKAIEKIEIGQVVIFEKENKIRLANAQHDLNIVGFAVHDMEKGDFIEYSPFKNTKDIIINGSNLKVFVINSLMKQLFYQHIKLRKNYATNQSSPYMDR